MCSNQSCPGWSHSDHFSGEANIFKDSRGTFKNESKYKQKKTIEKRIVGNKIVVIWNMHWVSLTKNEPIVPNKGIRTHDIAYRTIEPTNNGIRGILSGIFSERMLFRRTKSFVQKFSYLRCSLTISMKREIPASNANINALSSGC